MADPNPALVQAVKAFLAWRPEGGFPERMKADNPWIDKLSDGTLDVDQKSIPFFCEVYLYSLFGKEDARALLGYIRRLVQAAGLDCRALEVEVAEEYYKKRPV